MIDPGPDRPQSSDPLVELVDGFGRRTGTAAKSTVHRPPGILHRAFSVFLVDDRGRLLLQRRSASKYHSPGLWTNTCCGHPLPGESPSVAASRRLDYELGAVVAPDELTSAGAIRYRVEDPVTGLVEREFDHLFVGRVPSTLEPRPDEVMGTALVALDELDRGDPTFTAWFELVLEAARPVLDGLSRRP